MGQKAFAVFLQELRDGRAHSELSGQLAELITKVKETGKGGSLTFKVKIKPSTRAADVERVTISDAITVDLPQLEHGDDVFWITDDNDLSRSHPRQGSLELRDATPSAPSTFKEAQK
jgi:hypothetical protein